MTKLNDLQTILLSGASQRSSGQLLPAGTSVTAAPGRITKAIASLLKNSLVDEVPPDAPDQSWRIAKDQRFGAVINDAGRRAIGVEPDGGDFNDTAEDEQTSAATPVAPRGPTKAALVLSLLEREQGVTVAELVDATTALHLALARGSRDHRGALVGATVLRPEEAELPPRKVAIGD